MTTWIPMTFAAETLLEVKSAVKLVPDAGVAPVTSPRELFPEFVSVILNDFDAQFVGEVVSKPFTVTTPTL